MIRTWGVGTWVLFAVPPVILTLWAFFYLLTWYTYFNEPLTTVEFSYESNTGRVTGTAKSLRIDLRKGVVVANDVDMGQASTGEVISAKYAEISIPLPWNIQPSYSITVRDGDVYVQRYEDGSWNFQRIAPKPKAVEEAGAAYTLSAQNIRITFRDDYARPPKAWNGLVNELEVAAAADDARGFAVFAIRDFGTGDGTFVVSNSELSHVRLRNLIANPLPMRDYILSWPRKVPDPKWLTLWSASKASYKGDLSVAIAKSTEFSGNGVIDAVDFRYASYPAVDGRFVGAFGTNGISGAIDAQGEGLSASGRCSFDVTKTSAWFDGTAFAANERAVERLRIAKLPKGLAFRNVRWQGPVSIGNGIEVSGKTHAEYARYGDYEARNISGNLVGGAQTIRFTNVVGRAYDTTVFADGAVTLGKNPEVVGQVYANNIELTRVPNLPRDVLKGGKLDVRVLMSGPLHDVQATVRASGDALVAMRDKDASRVESFDFALTGTVFGDKLRVDAATAVGRAGSLSGTGSVALDGSNLDLKVAADSVDLGSIPLVDVGGIGFADLRVFGSTDRLRMTGLMEAYSASLGDLSIPFISARPTLDGKELVLTELTGRSGVSLITGEVRTTFGGGGKLSGSGEVADFGIGSFTEGVVDGLARGTWKLSGTLEDPIVDAELSGDEIVVDKVSLRDVSAKGRWAKGTMFIERADARLERGSIHAFGTWSPTGASAISATLDGVSASVFSPYTQDAVDIGGAISGTVQLKFTDGAPGTGSGELSLQDVALNGEVVGSGFIQASLRGKTVSATGAIGSLESYFVLDAAEYDWEKQALRAKLSTLAADLHDSLAIVRAGLKNRLSLDANEQVAKLEGKYSINADVDFRRQEAGNWQLAAGNIALSTSAMTFGGDTFGSLSTNVAKLGPRYDISLLEWTGGPGSLRLTGDSNFITGDGQLQLNGVATDLDLSWLQKFNANLAGVTGKLDSTFSASGETNSPTILLTAIGRNLNYNDFAAETFSLGPIKISDGQITGTGPNAGMISVRGFEAQLAELRLPFKYPFEISSTEPLYAKVVLPSRDLNDLSKFFGGLDTTQTSGRFVGGDFIVSGTRERIQTSGSVELIAEKLKFTEIDTPFRNVAGRATLADSGLSFDVKAQSSLGGSLAASGGVDLSTRTLTDPTKLDLDNFGFAYQLGPQSRARGVVTANLAVSGDAIEPLIVGRVLGNDAVLSLAGELFSRAPSGDLPFNPFFDIVLQLVKGDVSSSLLKASMSGQGKLQGPLRQADLAMDFAIDDGEISLPTMRIRVERGGTAAFKYGTDYRGEISATLMLDVNASTRITADAGFGPQRYLINLRITGDLLSEEDLNIDAESDPPDLSKNQILAILGQQKLFEDVVAAGTGGDFSNQVKSLLTSVFAPAVFGQFTRSLERTFGLEYIGLDFSPAGIGGVTLAKALGSGFTLEYRRVVEQYALVGEPLEEIRLSYRPMTSNPLLGRLKFSVSADRNGLLRVTLGYTKRF